MDTAKVLNDAADYIEKYGWWREQRSVESDQEYAALFPDDSNRQCAAFAITRVSNDPDTNLVARKAFVDYLGLPYQPGSPLWYTLLFDWNDSHEAEEVVGKLREAAKALA